MGDFDNWRGNSDSDLCDPRQNRRGNRDLRYLCCDLVSGFPGYGTANRTTGHGLADRLLGIERGAYLKGAPLSF